MRDARSSTESNGSVNIPAGQVDGNPTAHGRLACAWPDGSVRLLDVLIVRDLDARRALKQYPVEVNCATFSGNRLIAAGGFGDVYLLEAGR